MSEERILVVTVGTSLFSSASWSYEGEFKALRDYRHWVQDLLADPAGRRNSGATTSQQLQTLLQAGTQVTSNYFATDFQRPLRYSGELATLLRCSQRFGKGDESFPEFLGRSYREIQLLAATDVDNPSHVAASHLQVILSEKAHHPNVTMPGKLRSSHLHELLDHLRSHLVELASGDAEVDLLVTGGYKAYSLLAGKFVATQPKDHHWRALYLHDEDIGQLIVEGRDDTSVGQDSIVVEGTSWVSGLGED